MADTLTSLICLAAISLASFSLGRPLLRGLRVRQEDGVSTAVWSLMLGLIVAGMLWAVLGLLGLLYWWLIVPLTLAACVSGAVQIAREVVGWTSSSTDGGAPYSFGLPPAPREAHLRPVGPPFFVFGAAAVLTGLACLGALVAALAPPTAGDALCYHLDLPKRYLAVHELVHLQFNDHSTYPLLTEMWYLWALALEGPVTAQLLHWGLGVLFALAAVLLATPLVGRRWAWLAGAAVIFVPGVTNQMTAPLVDVAVAVPITLALVAWRQATIQRDSARWFVLAGLMLGAALSMKYLAVLFVAAMAVTWLWQLAREPGRRRSLLLGAAIVGVVSASVAGMWYLRAAWHRGNPVYPFFENLAGGDGPNVLRASKRPLGFEPLTIATAPWQITMRPEDFGGRGHRLGAMFLVALPGLLTARRLRGLRSLLAVAFLYAAGWYALRQNVRFLLPVVPPLAIGLVWFVMELRRFPVMPRTVAITVLSFLAVIASLVPLARSRDKLAVAFGIESRDAYLNRTEPTYACTRLANRVLPPGARILSQDYRAFYFDNDFVREAVFRRDTGYHKQISTEDDLVGLLRGWGFTHLLLAESAGEEGIHYNSTLTRLAEAQLACDADSMTCLIEDRFTDSHGAVRRYRLMELRQTSVQQLGRLRKNTVGRL